MRLQVNVVPGDAGPGAGLGLFAAGDVHAGGVLLSFPTDLGFRGTAQHNGVMVSSPRVGHAQ